jgi:hypothetical protein
MRLSWYFGTPERFWINLQVGTTSSWKKTRWPTAWTASAPPRRRRLVYLLQSPIRCETSSSFEDCPTVSKQPSAMSRPW